MNKYPPIQIQIQPCSIPSPRHSDRSPTNCSSCSGVDACLSMSPGLRGYSNNQQQLGCDHSPVVPRTCYGFSKYSNPINDFKYSNTIPDFKYSNNLPASKYSHDLPASNCNIPGTKYSNSLGGGSAYDTARGLYSGPGESSGARGNPSGYIHGYVGSDSAHRCDFPTSRHDVTRPDKNASHGSGSHSCMTSSCRPCLRPTFIPRDPADLYCSKYLHSYTGNSFVRDPCRRDPCRREPVSRDPCFRDTYTQCEPYSPPRDPCRAPCPPREPCPPCKFYCPCCGTAFSDKKAEGKKEKKVKVKTKSPKQKKGKAGSKSPKAKKSKSDTTKKGKGGNKDKEKGCNMAKMFDVRLNEIASDIVEFEEVKKTLGVPWNHRKRDMLQNQR